ncbi:hypothetical protein AX761_23310 [Rhizobium sp. 58]|nr:hypothetical protein AX761_23310 [Rhizobium sp. 58]
MFKMVKTLTAWWPVKVYEPDPEKPGQFVEFAFEAEFEILDRNDVKRNADERAVIFAEAEQTGADFDAIQQRLEALELKIFQRTIRNWRGIVDDKDEVFPFTNENFLTAWSRTHIREGFGAAYAEAIDTGKARLGN